MDGKTRWAISFIIVAALAGIVLIGSAGSASAGTISGAVTDSSKTPVPGASVTLYQNGKECTNTNNPAITTTNGYYEFIGLPAGDYSVSVEVVADRIFSTSATIHVETGDATLNLQIPGYTYSPGAHASYVPTATPTPRPTPTPTPTRKPSPKPSSTPIPLPTVPEGPGFEVLLALAAMGMVAAAFLSNKK